MEMMGTSLGPVVWSNRKHSYLYTNVNPFVYFDFAQFRYQWEPPLEKLKFDESTGRLTVISDSDEPVFDYEAFKVETHFLTVSDNRGGNEEDRNVISVTLKINIQNINDEPPSIRAVSVHTSSPAY